MAQIHGQDFNMCDVRNPIIAKAKIRESIDRCVNDSDHWPSYITKQEWEHWVLRTGYSDFIINEKRNGSVVTLSISRKGQKKIIVVMKS